MSHKMSENLFRGEEERNNYPLENYRKPNHTADDQRIEIICQTIDRTLNSFNIRAAFNFPFCLNKVGHRVCRNYRSNEIARDRRK